MMLFCQRQLAVVPSTVVPLAVVPLTVVLLLPQLTLVLQMPLLSRLPPALALLPLVLQPRLMVRTAWRPARL